MLLLCFEVYLLLWRVAPGYSRTTSCTSLHSLRGRQCYSRSTRRRNVTPLVFCPKQHYDERAHRAEPVMKRKHALDHWWKERSEIRMSTLSPMLNSREVPLEKQEFQTFYEENVGQIYRYMYHQVGNREEAEDLTSHVFLKAVSSIDHERSRLSRQKWLFLIARTTMADYWRTHYRLPMRSLDEVPLRSL